MKYSTELFKVTNNISKITSEQHKLLYIYNKTKSKRIRGKLCKRLGIKTVWVDEFAFINLDYSFMV